MRLEVYLGFRVLSRHKTQKIIAQYFCFEFILRTMFLRTRLNIIAQYFIPLVGSGRVNILSGTDAACVAIVSVLCLERTRQEMFAERNISSTLASTLLPRARNNTFL